MRLTIIESPFRSADDSIGEDYRIYLKRAVLDSISRGETPFASHGFFTQFLDDTNPQERNTGITLGYNFWIHARKIAFYTDYGMSSGMKTAKEFYTSFGDKNPDLCYSYRKIGENPSA